MGVCASRNLLGASNIIRVVHLNGYVEDFSHPVTASQVTGSNGKLSKYFICTASQLITNSSTSPLKPDYFLQPGLIYFLLPYSALASEASPNDLAAMTKRLTAKAKSVKSPTATGSTYLQTQLKPSSVTHVSLQISKSVAASKQSWKPNLDTIGEKSFTRSESDLQEMRLSSFNRK
ncbi:hypothetical protein ACFE04_011297 [Oxalis oulophora]